MKTFIKNLFMILALLSGINQAATQGTTTFAYQGQLRDGGTNANGTYGMTFKLYDAASGGNQIGNTLSNSPTLANGLFTANLDFGAGVFDGSARWLEIHVAGDTLIPRAQVVPSPYALYAAVAATVTNSAIASAQLVTNAVPAAKIASGQVVKSLNGLADAVTLSAGQNISLTPNGNNVQISATLTNGVAIGPWTIDSGNVLLPGGGTSINALRFQTNGVTRMAIDKDGNGVLINGGLRATGGFTTGGNIQVKNSGNTITITNDGLGQSQHHRRGPYFD